MSEARIDVVEDSARGVPMLIHHLLPGLTSVRRRVGEFVEGMMFAFIAVCVGFMELFESED
jgi:hypothetical protein